MSLQTSDSLQAPLRPTEDQLLASSSPPLSAAQAQAICCEVFGVDGDATLLTGERDQNFLIAAVNGQYVMKVTHPSEPAGVTEFQTLAQLHALRSELKVPIPKLYAALDGAYIHRRPLLQANATQAIRLISFAEGVPLHLTKTSAAQRQALGRALASLDAALAPFQHPQMDHQLLWDVQHLGRLAELLGFIDDAEKQQLAKQALQHICTVALPAAASLPHQVIHNDLNPYNVMAAGDDAAQISAILDFGDMVRAPRVQDLAVACAYQLSQTRNPLETAVDFMQAYQAVYPLERSEWVLVPDLIAARLLTTVLITEWRAKQHPKNRTYILRNNPRCWDGLQRLAQIPLPQQQAFVLDSIF